jgi:hypothetical protein
VGEARAAAARVSPRCPRMVYLAPRLLTAPQERLMAVVARGEE